MRRIYLETIPIRLAGMDPEAPDIEFSYARNIIGIVNGSAAERGLPLSEVHKALRILDPIERADRGGAAAVDLEDADWENLKKMVEAFRGWRIIHKAVPDFVKAIAEAQDLSIPLPTEKTIKE